MIINSSVFSCFHYSVFASGSQLSKWNVGVPFSGEHAVLAGTHEPTHKTQVFLDINRFRSLTSILGEYRDREKLTSKACIRFWVFTLISRAFLPGCVFEVSTDSEVAFSL